MDFFKDYGKNNDKDINDSSKLEASKNKKKNVHTDLSRPKPSIHNKEPTPIKPKPPTSPYARESTSTNRSSTLSDLYESDDWRKEMEEESESLRQLLMYDGLKLYARVRNVFTWITGLVSFDNIKGIRFSRKQIAMVASIVVVIGSSIFGINHFLGSSEIAQNDDQDIQAEVLSESIEPVEPEFSTVKPKNTDIKPQGITGDGQVASYQDQINNVTLTVSQQPTPQEVKNGEFGLQGLAESVNGTESVSKFVLDGQDVFLVELNNSSQIAVLEKGELLLFIRASRVLDEQTWVSYISSLE